MKRTENVKYYTKLCLKQLVHSIKNRRWDCIKIDVKYFLASLKMKKMNWED